MNNREQKIYSRPRIKIKKNINKNNKRWFRIEKRFKYRTIRFFLVIILLFFISKYILEVIYPVINKKIDNKVKSIFTVISNEKAGEIIKDYSYEDLFNIEKDTLGNVVMIKANVITINEINSKIATKIQNEMNSKKVESVEIAVGSLLGLKVLTGRGPKINILISSIGNVDTNLKSEFINKGINQTLHRVYLEVKCTANIFTTFHSEDKEVNNQILLMENIIIGNVPDTFYNIEGVESSNDAMELIQ